MRDRFPGITAEWARFDGPAGTQMVDRAIDAVRAHAASGISANVHGAFAASEATTRLVADARASVGALIGGDAAGVVFGANMTTLTFAFTRAVARTLDPGDEVVGTRLDHDANVTPWRLAAHEADAGLHLVPFDPATGRLAADAVVDRITPRTRWVAITGASNALGTMPDLAPVVEAAHGVGAHVFVDAVHLVPHHPVDARAIGCDVLATSPYKWYGPHAGVLWLGPEVRERLEPYKVRPAPESAPERWETGTAAFGAIAGAAAAARFLTEAGPGAIRAREGAVFAPLLAGLLALPRVRVLGPTGLEARTPTVAFTVEGRHPDEVAAALARAKVAVWSGSYYAVEVMASLGLAESGGAVRAGVSCYTEPGDVQRLLAAVAPL